MAYQKINMWYEYKEWTDDYVNSLLLLFSSASDTAHYPTFHISLNSLAFLCDACVAKH